jgi:thiol-disulfide isomerase/thioredoxin
MILASGWLPILLSVAAAAAAGEPQTLLWTSADRGPAWNVGFEAVALEAGTPGSGPLDAPSWFEPLPRISIQLLNGGSFPLSDAQGKVLLLDFWASWCAPCLKELPSLQDLYVTEGPRGLAALAVNVGEPRALARRTAEALKLTLPLGSYDRAVDDAFHARELPTVVVADRRGRVRGRWEGWREGLEKTIADRARELLAEDPAGPKRTLGEVLAGAGLLEVEWVRDLPAAVTGVAVVPGPGARPRIEVAAGRELAVIERDGRIVSRADAPPAAGRLVALRLDATATTAIAGYRPGGKDVVVLDLVSGTGRTFTAPAHLLDLAAIGADPPTRSQAILALATVEGLYLSDLEGKHPRRIEGTGETVSVRKSSGGGAAVRLVALGADGSVRWVDLDGRIVRTAAARSGDARLVLAEGEDAGFGTAPAAVVAAASGRFLSRDAALVAAATGGTLILVDPAKGTTVWRARWEGIAALAPGDLDGDGNDELVVAAGRSVALLRARR